MGFLGLVLALFLILVVSMASAPQGGSIVLGACALLGAPLVILTGLAFLPAPLLLGLGAIVMGAIGRGRASREGEPTDKGGIGIVLGILAILIVSILFFVVAAGVAGAL